MKIAIFVSIWSAGMSSADLSEYFSASPLRYLKAEKAVHAVEIYTPEPGDVSKMDDIPAPAVIIQIDMDNADAAQALVQTEEFRQKFMRKDEIGVGLENIKLELTEVVHFPLPGLQTPPPRTAPLSFVVRYYGPVRDASRFADYYTAHHPPILAKFPGIRNVLCYLPLGWRTTGAVEDDRLIIGNEVVFDDLAALQAALHSEVLSEAQQDGKQFPEFGYNSHHAMHRENLYTR